MMADLIRTIYRLIALGIIAIFFCAEANCTAVAAEQPVNPENVSIQLRWSHQFQFAGYYAAVEKGFYTEEGLNVTLLEAVPGQDRIEPVLKAHAQYGVGDAGLLAVRAEGKPVVLLAQIFQHSPSVLMSRRDSGIFSPYELVGKKIMISADPISSFSVRAMLLETLGSLDRLTILPRSFDQELFQNSVDAVAGYLSNEPFLYTKKGMAINVIDPRSYGIDFYGDNLFTTEHEVANHPERVEKILRATIKGWQYALKNEQEIIDLILAKYNPALDREKLAFEAKVIDQMILPDLIPIGDILTYRYDRIAQLFQRLGLTQSDKVPEGFFYRQIPVSDNLLTADERGWLRAHPGIQFAFSNDYQPVLIVGEDGSITGIQKEIIDLMNQRLGTDFAIVADDLPAIRNMVKKREVAGPLAMSPIVAERYRLLPSKTIFKTFPVIYGKDSTESLIGELKDLFGTKCVIINGSPEVEELIAPFEDRITIIRVKTALQALKLIYESKADYFIGLAQNNYLVHTNQLVGIRPILAFHELQFPVVIGVRDDWPELVAIINKGLATISDQERNNIFARWSILPKVKEASWLVLSEQEREWLAENQTLRVVLSELPPFVFVNEGQDPSGIAIDILRLISERTGVDFTYETDGAVPNDDPNPELLAHHNPLLANDVTRMRSEAYMQIPLVVLSRESALPVSSLQDLVDKVISVKRDSRLHHLISQDYPGTQLRLFDSEQDALKAVHSGDATFYIGALPFVSQMIAQNSWTDLKVAGPSGLEDLELFFEIPSGRPELLSFINKGLDSITDHERAVISNKYIPLNYEYRISMADVTIWFVAVIALSGLLLLGSFYWNRSLAARVRAHTADLSAVNKQKMALQNDLAHINRIMTISEMSASLAHEINQPLGAILNNASSALILHANLSEGNPKIEELLDSISKDAYRSGQVIRRIRGVVKKGESNAVALDINNLLDESVDLFRNTLDTDHITLHMDKRPDLPRVIGDRIRLQQVVINLISNAVDAMRDSDRMVLTIQSSLQHPDRIVVSIGDSGTGIPDGMKDKLFDPFSTTKKNGLGIGLRVCQSIIEEHGGRIWVDDHTDEGTIFRFSLKTEQDGIG